MSDSARLREHPQSRFTGPFHHIDLAAAAQALRAEAHGAVDGHRQITLHHQGPLTQVLFAFDTDGELKEHRVDGTVTMHLLEGRLEVRVAGAASRLVAGQMLIIDSGIPHTVRAETPAEMLLTVCRERRPPAE